MKIFFTIIIFGFYHFASAQPPENNTNGNVLNASPTINAIQNSLVSPDSITTVQPESRSKRNDVRREKTESKSAYKVKSKKSQSIQSSQIIEQEYEQSRMQSNTRMISLESQKKMESELDKIEKDENASFEYNLYRYTLTNYDVSKESYINEAERLRPNDSRVVLQKTANECVKGDSSSMRLYLEKLTKNKTLDQETLDYTEDVVLSSTGNDLLITHGTKDTYGVIHYQLNHPNSAASLIVVSLELMRSNDYRELLRTKGVLFPNSNKINTAYFKSFCALNAQKKIAVSLTLPVDYLKSISSHSVPFGLVLITGNQKDLCLSDLERLWNSKLNKRNLTLHKSQQAKNYAKNYRPTEELLRRFEAQKLSSPYMNPSKDFKTKSSKIKTPRKN